jgi:hypothetical protein
MPKNFLKIPPAVMARINRFALDDVVVACAKRISINDVAGYLHLGLRVEHGKLVLPEPFLPSRSSGKYSLFNVDGKDVKRTDLPKISKTFSFYAPNWGNSSNGEHLVSHTRKVWQRDFIPPKEVLMSATLLAEHEKSYDIKFAIDQVLGRQAPDFESDLLYNLNILQENVGAVDVFESDATLADYAATIHVDWELLPVGKIGPCELAEQLLQRAGASATKDKEVIQSRLELFEKLKPTDFIAGSSGFSRYFGAKYFDDFVVFENVRYGNAMYVMFENWQTLSQRSRIDLLKGPREGFERIEHRDIWEDRLKAMLEYHRDRKRRGRGFV